ncbi:23S rRNA (guanosine(2251)-2'-O)-methyltransferase RlmB [Nibribacter ruber]|uniref:23S rRNA (Guanosine(2251)-2'-O)-methyltransferase RlmB n=1 Tax=Nibribacter ruber TaxID=2698458 RepID=A0A6P1P3R4_9BACT|nr:23S rRNA (guanosine(2251)-2'-O)-methyltransferase RlmB [Nibribacter ruber]QHL89005.1 23S rRNA (guanosine(2251)-2'-O)-methyltransferase RlmB [Nibribacter ruber]
MENRNYKDRDGGRRPNFHKQPKVDKMEMVFGLRPILEALHAGKTLEKIYLQKGVNHSISQEISELARAAGVPISIVPPEKLDQLTRKNHQGAVAYLSSVTYLPLDEIVASIFEKGKDPLLLVLDRITDVRNFGAIARNAECMGVDAIVIPSRGAAQINADALKTSAGALNLIAVCRENNLKDTLHFLKQSGIRVVACTEKAEEELTDASVDLTGPLAIMMGSEEDGISPEYLKKADVRVKIPMTGQIQSLNVSVASGIVLYETLRQRSKA